MYGSTLLIALALAGIVRDEGGRPVEGATVVVRKNGSPLPGAHAVTRTGQDGRFLVELELHDDDTHANLGVFADGFVALLETGMELDARSSAARELDLVLSRGATIEGVVVDASSREPVPGAIVEKRIDVGTIAPPAMPLLGTVRMRADARGRFVLGGVGPLDQTITATAPGYARSEADIAALVERSEGRPLNVSLALSPGTGIYGRVLSADGEPASGAQVGARWLEGPQGSAFWEVGSVKWTATDDEGRFALLGVERGRHQLVVRQPDAAFLFETVEVGSGDLVLDDLTLASGAGGLSARLVDPEGAAVEGTLRIQSLEGESVPGVLFDRVVAHGTGAVQILALPPGEYELSAAAPGFAEPPLPPVRVPAEGVADLGEVVFGGGLSITGVVVDGSNAPIPEANVYVWPARPFSMLGRGGRSVNTESDADGAFSMSGLEPGRYRIGASAKGYRSEDLLVEAGDSDVVVELAPTGGITGYVVDGDGLPVRDFRFAIGLSTPGGRQTTEATSDPADEGRFTYEALETGSYRLGILAPGFKPERMDDVVVTAGTITDVGTIVLRTGGTIRGIVFDAEGDPVANAELTLNPGHPGRSDADGRFDIRGLEVGVIDVRVRHPDFAQTTLEDVELASEDSPVDLRIELGRGGAIDGVVRDRDGFGLEGRRVRYREPGDRRSRDLRTDAEGRFRLDRLEPARYLIELMSAEPRFELAVQTAEADVVEGRVAAIELVSREVRVSGQVLRNDVVVPDAHVALRLSGARTGFGFVTSAEREPTGPLPLNAVTGPDGFYELYVEAPGEYQVNLTTPDGRSFPRKTLVIPDVPAHVADLRYGTVTLHGEVVSEEAGEPIAEAWVRAYPRVTGPVANVTASARTDAGGRFFVEIEPGDYVLRTAARDYAPGETPVSLSEHEVAGTLRITLGRGGAIRGVAVDANGNHPGRYYVHAVLDAGASLDPPVFASWAEIRVDGTFEFRDLRPGRYNLLAGSDLLGFALAEGVTPGQELTLRLRPAAWVDVTVSDPDGAPLAGAQVVVSAFRGRKVRGVSGRTDERGRVALYAPAGTIELKAVHGDDFAGAAVVASRAEERTPAHLVLQPAR